MSIRIGTNSTNGTTVATTEQYRERIILNSIAHSNLIILNSTTSNTNILYDNFTQGRSNQHFVLQDNEATIFSFNAVSGRVFKPLYVSDNLRSTSATVDGIMSANTINATNMSVTSPSGQNAAFASWQSPVVANDVLAIYPEGRVFMNGRVGIGSASPLEILHVQGNTHASGNSYVANNATASVFRGIKNPALRTATDSFIQITSNEDVIITGSTSIKGNFIVEGNQVFTTDQEFNNMFVRGFAQIEDARFTIPQSESDTIPLTMTATWGRNSNLLQFDMMESQPPGDSNLVFKTAVAIDSHGRLAIGLSNPTAILDIEAYEDGPLISVKGVQDTSCDVIHVDQFANVGFGTSTPMHKLHIDQCSNLAPGIGSNAIVAIYSSDQVHRPSFLEMFNSNSVCIAELTSNGALRLGAAATDGASSNYGLDMTLPLDVRLPSIETTRVHGSDGVISFNNTSIIALSNVETSNLFADMGKIRDIETNYLFASNYEILAFQGFDSNIVTGSNSIFNLRTSNLLFRGSMVYFSDKDDDTVAIVTNDATKRNPITDGKVYISVQNSIAENGTPNNLSSCGLSVNGVNSACIRVASRDSEPSYELVSPIINPNSVQWTGILGMNTAGSMFFKHKNNTVGSFANRIEISTAGRITLNQNSSITSDGNLGVRLGTDISPLFPLDVKGTMSLKNDSGSNVLYVSATGTNRNVGINMNTEISGQFQQPGFPLHVIGQSYISSNVGIGTAPSSAYHLSVNGNTNIIGNIYQNGNLTTSSQWTSNVGSNTLLHTAGSVGIGTTSVKAGNKLHVQGSIYSSSNVTAMGSMFASGSFVSTSDRAVKYDLVRISDALDRVSQLTGYTFSRSDGPHGSNGSTGARETGLIAQDVLEVLPEAVATDASGRLSVAYGNLAGLIVEALKDLKDRVAALELLVHKI